MPLHINPRIEAMWRSAAEKVLGLAPLVEPEAVQQLARGLDSIAPPPPTPPPTPPAAKKAKTSPAPAEPAPAETDPKPSA